MGKLIRLNSIARPIIFEDREKRIEEKTKKIKEKQKELYERSQQFKIKKSEEI